MRYTKEEDNFLIKNYKDKGQSWCAEKLNRTNYSIKNRAKLLNLKVDIKKVRGNFTDNDVKFLIDNYEHLGIDESAKKLNKSRRQIIRKTKELRLNVSEEYIKNIRKEKTQEYWDNNEKNFNNYNIHPDNFKNFNDKNLCYILGLLWADGYIINEGKGSSKTNMIGIEAVKKDLDELKSIFENVGEWNYYERHRKNRKKSLIIRTNNRPIVEFLIDNDYGNKSKVSADKILNLIPTENMSYFLLGFFDGDGGVYKNNNSLRLSFYGSYQQEWNWLEDILRELKISYSIKRTLKEKNSSSRLNFSKKEAVIKFYNYIYKDEIGLKRKRNIIENFLINIK